MKILVYMNDIIREFHILELPIEINVEDHACTLISTRSFMY